MKSTIKIEFDYDRKEPYLEVKLHNTDDLRDKMLQSFFQQLGGNSNILRVEFQLSPDRYTHPGQKEEDYFKRIAIFAIPQEKIITLQSETSKLCRCEPLIQEISDKTGF